MCVCDLLGSLATAAGKPATAAVPLLLHHFVEVCQTAKAREWVRECDGGGVTLCGFSSFANVVRKVRGWWGVKKVMKGNAFDLPIASCEPLDPMRNITCLLPWSWELRLWS